MMGKSKIMILGTQDLRSRLQIHKLFKKINFNNKGFFFVALSQIDDGVSENHGTWNSGLTR